MTHPDASRYVFQWHVDGPVGPINWQDVHGIRTNEFWAPLEDILASSKLDKSTQTIVKDESTQNWGEFCDELQLPDEVRNLEDADARVKSWGQLTKDLALPEEWGFRTQLTIARVADDVEINYTPVESKYHTRDAGFEPGEGREAHFNRLTHVESKAAEPTLVAKARQDGRQPSELVADNELDDIGLQVLTFNIPSRLDELDRRVDALAGPQASEIDRLVARVSMLDNQRLDNDLYKRITDPAKRADYVLTHDFSRDVLSDLRYRDSLEPGFSRGLVPDYNPDGSPRYDSLIIGPNGEILSNRRAYAPFQSGDQLKQAQVDAAVKQASHGDLSDWARRELIERSKKEQEQAIREMQTANQNQDYEAAQARFERAAQNEAKLKQDWDGPRHRQSQKP